MQNRCYIPPDLNCHNLGSRKPFRMKQKALLIVTDTPDTTEQFSKPKKVQKQQIYKTTFACIQTSFRFSSTTDATLKIALIPCRNLQGKFHRSRTKGHCSQTDHKSVHQYNHMVKTLKEGNSPWSEPTWPLQAIY